MTRENGNCTLLFKIEREALLLSRHSEPYDNSPIIRAIIVRRGIPLMEQIIILIYPARFSVVVARSAFPETEKTGGLILLEKNPENFGNYFPR